MKKLKYLLGLSIVGLGLLFNQSFGISLELIDGPNSSQYLIDFSTRSTCSSSVCGTLYSYMNYYYKYYVGSILNTYTYGPQPSNCETEDCTSYQFNRSMTGLDLFYSSTVHYAAWSRYPYTYTYPYGTNINYQTLLGQQQSLGLVYVCPDCFNEVVNGPKFKVGNSFYGAYENVKIVNSTESNYIRLYNEFNTGFDISNINFISGSGFPLNSWQYFTPYQSRTSYGRIATQGYSFGRIGSPISLGFSTVYSLDSATAKSGYVNYTNLQFRTYYDTVIVPLKLMTANNQWILLDSDLSGFFFDGVLVLPANSYNSGLSLGSYILAKDPNNTQRVLYELYSCNINLFPYLSSGDCIKLDAGYLTYNGSQNVLPFTDADELFSINYSPDYYPLLTDLTRERIYTEQTSNGFKITDHYYGFETDPDVDIEQALRMFSPDNEVEFKNKCLMDTGFLAQNGEFCSMFFPEGVPTHVPGTYDQYIVTSYDENGNPTYWITYQEDMVNQLSGYTRTQDSGGNWYLSCTSETCDPNYNSGIVSQNYTGNVTTSLTNRYDEFFSRGMFFSCPFSYNNANGLKITETTILKNIGNKVLYPINCMIAGFRHGRNMNFLGSGGQVLQNRLLNSEDYRGIYNLLDIILSLGILFFAFKIYNLIK